MLSQVVASSNRRKYKLVCVDPVIAIADNDDSVEVCQTASSGKENNKRSKITKATAKKTARGGVINWHCKLRCTRRMMQQPPQMGMMQQQPHMGMMPQPQQMGMLPHPAAADDDATPVPSSDDDAALCLRISVI